MMKYGKKIAAIFLAAVFGPSRCNRRWLWTSITSVAPLLSVEAMLSRITLLESRRRVRRTMRPPIKV